MSKKEIDPLYSIELVVGCDMTERHLYFDTPPNVDRMQPGVEDLLHRDKSFIAVSDVAVQEDENSRLYGKSFITIRTTHPSDWSAPALPTGELLSSGSIKDKTALAHEAGSFTLRALHAAKELSN